MYANSENLQVTVNIGDVMPWSIGKEMKQPNPISGCKE
jgi:hypothetical protein